MRKGELMVLAMIQELCMICNRLLLILDAQQAELRKRGCPKTALDAWERETNHLRDLLRKLEG